MADETHDKRTRKPRGRVGEGGRKLHSAGSAVVVTTFALGLAVLLNAPGVHKSATIQQEGWKRDLALALTGPLKETSEALYLDQPRRGLKALAGRADDDDIDTGVAVPETPAETPVTPPPKRKITPDRKLRIWVAGDSLVIVPGQSLLRAIGGSPVMEPVSEVDGRIASGLERPDVFNWFKEIPKRMRKDKPGVVVLMFGANDDHGFMTGLPPGREIEGGFGSESWEAEYRRRVGGLMDTVTRGGAYLVWVGLPITNDPAQTARFDAINSILVTEADKRRGRVSYLDTYFFFAGPDGGYAEYVANARGALVKMRADDGVHFERAAGDLIARQVLKRLHQRFDLSSWRRDAAPDG
jgi:hypothetical protein